MSAATLIAEIGAIGARHGFVADPEYWTRAAAGTDVYRPKIDCLWAARLAEFGYDTEPLDEILGAPLASPYGLLGFELEATDPTTKRQFTNLANLAVAAVPYACLVVDSTKRVDAYRRASRVIRTFNRRFGHRQSIALDIGTIRLLGQLPAAAIVEPASGVVPNVNAGLGGEGAETLELRRRLVERGLKAGFEVRCSEGDPAIESAYHEIKAFGDHALDVALTSSETKVAEKAGDLFTDSKPDVVWAIRTGPGLYSVVETLARLSPAARSAHQAFGPVPELLPVATFEIETKMDKHGAGALLTLAARPGIGILISVDGAASGQRVLNAYRPIIGARNVVAIGADMVEAW